MVSSKLNSHKFAQMSLSPSSATDSRSNERHISRRKRRHTSATELLKPEEYARAVLGYSNLPTGAGQNHIPLGRFLTSEAEFSTFGGEASNAFVTEYVLDIEDASKTVPTQSSASLAEAGRSDLDPDSADERPRDSRRITSFSDPKEFYRHTTTRSQPESCVVFLSGFMNADWINHVGVCHGVDPELFCRHLDFRQANDNANSFSVPALPSSSWHLFELPIITIGSITGHNEKTRLERVEILREEAAKDVREHHHRIARLQSSGMAVGESMIRDLYVFDETHFAIEQQAAVSLQNDKEKKVFSLLVWLDSGSDISKITSLPWLAHRRGAHLLPTIQHRHMNALKCHLLHSPSLSVSHDPNYSTRLDQSAALLPKDYGRTLNPEVMSRDALYSLTEVLNFAASSNMQFCNLIDIKLDQYTSLPPAQDMKNLPNLKYIKQILYHHIQKTQRVLESLANTKADSRWPKDRTSPSSRKAVTAAQSVEQDFQHILNRLNTLHERVTQAISTLMSSISITESQQAIDQAKRLSKLTFLAFFFVPLSFTTSLFGMNVKEFANGQIGVKWWVLSSILVLSASIAVLFIDVSSYSKPITKAVQTWWQRLLF